MASARRGDPPSASIRLIPIIRIEKGGRRGVGAGELGARAGGGAPSCERPRPWARPGAPGRTPPPRPPRIEFSPQRFSLRVGFPDGKQGSCPR